MWHMLLHLMHKMTVEITFEKYSQCCCAPTMVTPLPLRSWSTSICLKTKSGSAGAQSLPRQDILKSQLITKCSMWKGYKAEFEKFHCEHCKSDSAGAQSLPRQDILKSQLTTKCTLWKGYRAKFWEILLRTSQIRQRGCTELVEARISQKSALSSFSIVY